MIDRETLRAALDCATRINDDGKAQSVISDAQLFVDWIEQRLSAQKEQSRDRLKEASMQTVMPGI